jgi:hypothetical protein
MRPGRTTSPRACAALALLGLLLLPASRAIAAEPDLVLPRVEPPPPSHTRAYVALGAGIALAATSFVLSDRADRAYGRYLAASDPVEIAAAYDDARRFDRWSAGTLLAGTGALALGVYWRFIRRPSPVHGAALDLEPVITSRHAGLALAVRWP